MKTKSKYLKRIFCILLCAVLLCSSAALSTAFKVADALDEDSFSQESSMNDIASEDEIDTEQQAPYLDLPPSVPLQSQTGFLMIHNTSIPYRELLGEMYDDYYTEDEPTYSYDGSVGSGSYRYTITLTSDEPLEEAYEVTIYDEYYGNDWWSYGKYLVHLADDDNKLYVNLDLGCVAKIELPSGTSYTVEQTNAPVDPWSAGIGGWYDANDTYMDGNTVSGTIYANSPDEEVRADWYYANLHMATLRLARFSRMPDLYGPRTDFDDGSSCTFKIKLTKASTYDINPLLDEYEAYIFHIYDNITADIGDVYEVEPCTLTLDEDGYLTFELKYNEEIVITIPEGTAYSVEELGDYRTHWFRYYPDEEAMVGPEPELKMVILPIEGEVLDYAFDLLKDTSLIKYFCVNYYAGDLTVSKTVTGTAADEEKEFTFTVTLDGTYEFAGETMDAETINGDYGDMYFENGVATFTLKHNESKTALDLPDGLTYTVVESDNEGYTVTSTGETGKIELNKEAKAEFVNHKDGELSTTPSDEPTSTPDEPTTTPDEPTTTPSEPTTTPSEPTTTPNEPTTTPDKSVTASGNPNTGDNSHLNLWIALSVMSLLGLVFISIPRIARKKQ